MDIRSARDKDMTGVPDLPGGASSRSAAVLGQGAAVDWCLVADGVADWVAVVVVWCSLRPRADACWYQSWCAVGFGVVSLRCSQRLKVESAGACFW